MLISFQSLEVKQRQESGLITVLLSCLKYTHDYIATVLLSSQSAKNTVTKILDGLKSLEAFPEAGFDADEKIGVKY